MRIRLDGLRESVFWVAWDRGFSGSGSSLEPLKTLICYPPDAEEAADWIRQALVKLQSQGAFYMPRDFALQQISKQRPGVLRTRREQQEDRQMAESLGKKSDSIIVVCTGDAGQQRPIDSLISVLGDSSLILAICSDAAEESVPAAKYRIRIPVSKKGAVQPPDSPAPEVPGQSRGFGQPESMDAFAEALNSQSRR